jgi:hypothetical protein
MTRPAIARTLRATALAALIALPLAAPRPAFAWVYPEHRDIAVLAVVGLDPERRAAFDALWATARSGREARLCVAAADVAQGVTPTCIDWAALPAIAGDHSCSAREMLTNALDTQWILQVADVAAQLKVDLAQIPIEAPPSQLSFQRGLVSEVQREIAANQNTARRQNALRTSDTRLQRADPEYISRAGSNNAHFLAARTSNEMTPNEYATWTLGLGAELSALGVYGWYHLSALQKATRLANESLPPAERQALALSMLADEAFALHFLQDVFASGHVAGTWGDASQRKGTHDFYNEAGLEVFLWNGSTSSVVLMGDAHMRPEDAALAARAVRASLEQVLDHATGRTRPTVLPHTPGAPSTPDAFDVCANDHLPRRPDEQRVTRQAYALVAEVMQETPIPGLGPGLGAMPRFRAEVGPFIGVSGSFDARAIGGGFIDGQSSNGGIVGVDLSVRAGFGMDGLIGESADGLVFASIGIRGDSASSNKFTTGGLGAIGGSLTAAIPSRIGLSTRLRMPFWLVPGDLLLLSPLFLIDRAAYTNMAVTAGNGGLIPWQSGLATRFGRFQFVLGREIGATFYGLVTEDTMFWQPTPTSGLRLVNFKSTFIDVPILEYRPYRAFDTRQSSAVLVQLFAGADIPYGVVVASPPGLAPPGTKTVYSIGLRLLFNWRRYF